MLRVLEQGCELKLSEEWLMTVCPPKRSEEETISRSGGNARKL